MFSTASIQAYLEWQNALSRYGVTQLATDAFFRLAREIEANPFLDNEGFDRALERLHRAAYPGRSDTTASTDCWRDRDHLGMKLAADGRPGARARGYTVRWQKTARRFLAKHPTCARFGIDPKCKGLAAEVDHIVPHGGDLRLFWDRRNWQGLCKGCHSRKTLAEQRAKPQQLRVDVDGMPLDPSHHWNLE